MLDGITTLHVKDYSIKYKNILRVVLKEKNEKKKC